MEPTASLTAADRRERLALLCQLDRANLTLLLRQAPRRVRPTQVLPDFVHDLLQTARFMPGPLGRWARHAGMIERFLRPLAQLAPWFGGSAR